MRELVNKSWGQEEIVVNDERSGYCGKIMRAEPPNKSRIERHMKKDEVFYVLDGVVVLELFGHGDEPRDRSTILLRSGDSYRLIPGHWHRFGAGENGTRFVEFSSFHSNEDVERRDSETV